MKSVPKIHLLHQQILHVRRTAPIVAFVGIVLLQIILWSVQPYVPPAYHIWLVVGLYGLVGSLIAWFVLGWLAQKIAYHEQIQAELQVAHKNLAETHRQLLAVHDIGREIASASDMQQVLELAARAPGHLTSAVGSTVITFDNDYNRLNLDMAWGLSDTYLDGLRERIEAGVHAGRCVQCNPLMARVSSDCPLFDGMDQLAQREGIQSLICLPLTRNQKREGIINAYFPSPDGPPEEQIQLLNIVATEIASALDGARLRNDQLSTLYAVENLTKTKHSLDDLLNQVLEATLSGWGTCGGGILLYDEADAAWHHWTQRGLDDSPNHPYFELVLHLAEEAKQQKQPLLIANLSQYGTAAIACNASSAAVAPLLAGNDLLGVLIMMSDQYNIFQPHQTSFFAAVAHQAALAINNAQLYSQVQQMAVLEERYRLSREIHDGLAQSLSFLGWHMDHLVNLLNKRQLDTLQDELVTGQRMVREAYMNVREAIDGLRLQSEHDSGMLAALQEYIADFEDRTGIKTTLEINTEPTSLAPETELQLLRIVQEALVNIRKHADAKNIWVKLSDQPYNNRLNLTIIDDGCGFDPALPRGRKHLGLSTMRERAQSQGGDFSIITGPKQGTRITVTLPA